MIERWLTQTAITQRLLSDGTSGDTESYRNLYSIPCLIQEIDGNRQTMQNMGIYRPHRMYCSLGTDIKEDDYVLEGGRTFTVKGTINREQGTTVKHIEVLLEMKDA